ncbi:MAG: type II toxin-antitoxin system PemK/MazF family toxin [Pseudomonadota bacterium]|nr:type II toxin-antitoxin system PemK/MazF family toxin [Pseudomonadota bacterium]
MDIPRPEAGLVISYFYLWRREHERGQEEGLKARPSLIMANTTANSTYLVDVVPITHSMPAKGQAAVELPPAVKKLLNLDGDRSWVVLDEVNTFEWPGPDLSPVRRGSNQVSYGPVPPSFFKQIQAAFSAQRARRALNVVLRTDAPKEYAT